MEFIISDYALRKIDQDTYGQHVRHYIDDTRIREIRRYVINTLLREIRANANMKAKDFSSYLTLNDGCMNWFLQKTKYYVNCEDDQLTFELRE